MGKKSRNNKKKELKSSCAQCDEPDEGQMILCDWCERWYHFSCVKMKSSPKSELWKCPRCMNKDTQSENEELAGHGSVSMQNQEMYEEWLQRFLQSQLYRNQLDNRNDSEHQQNEIEQPIQVDHQIENQGVIKKDPNRRQRNLEDQRTLIYHQDRPAQNSTFGQMSLHSTIPDSRLQIELQRIEEEKILQQKIQSEKYQLEQQYLEKKYDLLLRGSVGGALGASTQEWIKKLTTTSVKSTEKPKENDEIDMDDFHRRLEALRLSPTESQQQPFQNIKSGEVFKTKTEKPQPKQFHEPTEEMLRKWNGQETKLSMHSSTKYDPNEPKVNVLQGSLHQPNTIPSDKWNVQLSENRILSKGQIAARQVVTKDLPIFYGKPEDWSLFYKRFVNSTELCGYSDAENLDRLQKCLKGTAFDAVQDFWTLI